MAKIDGKQEITKALWESGFHADPRSHNAYKPSGKEDWRIDLGKRTARLESRDGGVWRGVSDPLYFGHVHTAEFAKQWVTWAANYVRVGRQAGPEPRPVPTEKDVRTRTARQEKERVEREVKHGAGFYVVNANPNDSFVKKRIANFGPYKTQDEAIEQAWATYQEYLQMHFEYLLPVEVVEGTRDEAQHGKGYTWWVNGRRKALAADPRQTRMFADRRRARR